MDNGNSSNRILSTLMEKVESWETERIQIGHLVKSLGYKSFDLSILIIALPMIIPMPPGIPMFAGMLISMYAIQVLRGKQKAWTPRFIAQKTIGKSSTHMAIGQAQKRLNWVLRHLDHRLPVFLKFPFKQLTYLTVLLLGMIMILPIPFIGNSVPALACVFIMIGRLNHDGLIIIFALAGAFFSIGLNIFVAVESLELLEILLNR